MSSTVYVKLMNDLDCEQSGRRHVTAVAEQIVVRLRFDSRRGTFDPIPPYPILSISHKRHFQRRFHKPLSHKLFRNLAPVNHDKFISFYYFILFTLRKDRHVIQQLKQSLMHEQSNETSEIFPLRRRRDV